MTKTIKNIQNFRIFFFLYTRSRLYDFTFQQVNSVFFVIPPPAVARSKIRKERSYDQESPAFDVFDSVSIWHISN